MQKRVIIVGKLGSRNEQRKDGSMSSGSCKPKGNNKKAPSRTALKGTTRVKNIYSPGHTINNIRTPLFLEAVSAGFPSPAEDYLEGEMDLNEHLVKHPAATFFVRVTGESMIESGIRTGDLLVVDRAVKPADGHVVIAVLNGELTVKRICWREGKITLVPENKAFRPILIDSEMSFEIWGVVTHVIHPL